jgi:hypothetical protein
VWVHRGTRLDRADRTTLDGIPITTVTRTLIDMAGRLEDHRLLAITEDLIRRDIATPDRLRARLRALRSSGRPGGGRLEELLDQRGDGRPLESALEALAWPIIAAAASLPTPALGHRHRGRYRLDAWPNSRSARVRGWKEHGGRGKRSRTLAELARRACILPLTWDVCSRDSQRLVGWINDTRERS